MRDVLQDIQYGLRVFARNPTFTIVALLALLPLFVLSGDSRGQSAESRGKRTQITLATVSTNYREGLLRLAQEYERLHPEIEVRVTERTTESYAHCVSARPNCPKWK